MLNVSKQIYRELNELLPDMQHFLPFDRVNLAELGLPEINVVVFDVAQDNINFILGHHVLRDGRKIANPCFEITVNPESETANVVTYRDDHYFHDVTEDAQGVGTMKQAHANLLLFRWLSRLRRKTISIVR